MKREIREYRVGGEGIPSRAYLVAFHRDERGPVDVRVARLPAEQAFNLIVDHDKDGDGGEALGLANAELAYHYCQNDFQPLPACSASVGDVIELTEKHFGRGAGLYRVCGCGFKKLPDGTDPTELIGDEAMQDTYETNQEGA